MSFSSIGGGGVLNCTTGQDWGCGIFTMGNVGVVIPESQFTYNCNTKLYRKLYSSRILTIGYESESLDGKFPDNVYRI